GSVIVVTSRPRVTGIRTRVVRRDASTMWKHKATKLRKTRNRDGLCEWIESLPYVVRRAHGLSRTASIFDVRCRPLERRLTWLVVEHGARGGRSPSRVD